jgi:hypothetical protein
MHLDGPVIFPDPKQLVDPELLDHALVHRQLVQDVAAQLHLGPML